MLLLYYNIPLHDVHGIYSYSERKLVRKMDAFIPTRHLHRDFLYDYSSYCADACSP